MGSDHAVANAIDLCQTHLSCVIELIGEIYAFGEKCRVEAPLLLMLMKMMFPLAAFQEYAERIQERDFEPAGFAMTGGLKDVELFLEAAGEVRVPLPFASVVRDKQLTAIANGMSDHDWSAVYEITRPGCAAFWRGRAEARPSEYRVRASNAMDGLLARRGRSLERGYGTPQRSRLRCRRRLVFAAVKQVSIWHQRRIPLRLRST